MTSPAALCNSKQALLNLYQDFPAICQQAMTIRLVEQKFLELFSQGKLNGTVHTCVGQEFIGPAVCHSLQDEDLVFSNHRGHGHFIARTNNPLGLIRELMGRTTGVCGGIGGSQHLYAPGFISNGIQGGMTPIAAGVAMAEKLSNSNAVALVFVGDGTLGEGALYETLNLAGCFELPVVFVLERNGYAQSTATPTTTAGKLQARLEGFGWGYRTSDIWNPSELIQEAEACISAARSLSKPQFLDVACYRLNSHSKGDDNRDPAEIKHHQKIDPLNRLIAASIPELESYRCAAAKQVELWVAQAELEPKRTRLPDVPALPPARFVPADEVGSKHRVNTILNQSFDAAMERDPRIILLGEDICDRTAGATSDYGGAFKVTRGLSTKYPTRVVNFPISEAALIGAGTGLAMRGFRPIIEIMFGDFLTLCLDQLLQHAAKFHSMFDQQVEIPLVIRTPMGGKRGYGPTHSQSIEKFFVGIPGLSVVALNDRVSPEKLYDQVYQESQPVLVIENKVLYTRPLRTISSSPFRAWQTDAPYPTLRLAMDDRRPDVTVFCYGETLQSVEQAAIAAFCSDEIVTEIVCPTQIHPLDISAIAVSAGLSKRLLTVEEGTTTAAVSAEVVAGLAERGCSLKRVKRLGNRGIIASSVDAERMAIPAVADITQAIRELLS